jgi:hypothetical protein
MYTLISESFISVLFLVEDRCLTNEPIVVITIIEHIGVPEFKGKLSVAVQPVLFSTDPVVSRATGES